MSMVEKLTVRDVVSAGDDAYMNEDQLEFFRARLLRLREETQRRFGVSSEGANRTVEIAIQEPHRDMRPDRSVAEESETLSIRLWEIDAALARVRVGTYGYCEHTGEPIGVRRLLAHPTATVSTNSRELIAGGREHRSGPEQRPLDLNRATA